MTSFLFPVFHSLHPVIDVLACPDCGGRLRRLATIDDRAVIERSCATGTCLSICRGAALFRLTSAPHW